MRARNAMRPLVESEVLGGAIRNMRRWIAFEDLLGNRSRQEFLETRCSNSRSRNHSC